MEQSSIFAPMFGMFVLTFIVWVYMYSRRIPFIQSNNFTPEQLAGGEFTKLSPPYVVNPSDNLKNLFEMPVLFYAMCIYLYVTQQVDGIYLTAAWLFLTFRVFHSIMHCGANIVIVRFALYAISATACWFMIGRALVKYLF